MSNLLIDALESFRPPMPEGKEHLLYRDFPKMPPRLWEYILEQLEPYELHILSYAQYNTKNGILVRGQIWVHPDGLRNLQVAYERDKEKLFP